MNRYLVFMIFVALFTLAAIVFGVFAVVTKRPGWSNWTFAALILAAFTLAVGIIVA